MPKVPPLVLTPGTLCDAALWDSVRLPRGARLLRVVRGASLAAAARQVLSTVPDSLPVHLVGFSLGAIVAFEVLRLTPGRVARLTLLSANPQAPTAAQLDTWAGHERQVRAGQFETVIGGLAGAAGTQRQTVLDMARRVGPQTYLEQLALLRSRPDSRDDLSRFTGPLTVLVGQDDQVTPPSLAEEIQTLAPQAEVIKIPGAGHFLPLDAPQAVSDALGAVVHA